MAGFKNLVVGEKDSFLIRIIVKKAKDAGMESEFVRWNINDINSHWEGVKAVTIYVDENVRPKDEVLHFVSDKASETGAKVILIAEKNDQQYLFDRIAPDILYKYLSRPLDNEEYVRVLGELMKLSVEKKKSILIVDDDPNYLGLVRDWLKDIYKVSMANSGLQAIKWLGMNKADLILMDYEMPVTSGPQVLEMLRSDDETKGIPVIFLTGKSDRDSVMSVVALKPQGYFLKNIEREELLKNLRDFFKD